MLSIGVGDILFCKESQTKYRCLNIYKNICVFCQMGLSYLKFWSESYQVICEKVESKKYEIIQEEYPIVDKSKLKKNQLLSFEKKLDLMKETYNIFGPSFLKLEGRHAKPELIDLLKKRGVYKQYFWRTLVPYLQSGMEEYSLLDKRFLRGKVESKYNYSKKPGKKSEYPCGKLLGTDDYANFDEAIKNLEQNKVSSLSKAFNKMNAEHYMHTVMGRICLMEPGDRPSFNQFRYYVRKNLDVLKMTRNRTSEMEARNNSRFLIGDNLKNVYGPMDLVEVDACEIDLSVVYGPDRDDNGKYKCVGRPIMYAMVDVFTRAIVAVSATFDNNSFVGVSGVFVNLAIDKVKYAKEFGIEITDKSLWPSQCLPKRLRADRGPEFRGHELSRLCTTLNIQKELLPPGCGSLKGQVEQLYHQFHSDLTTHIEGIGHISKRFDSNHHKESTLTIEEFTRLLIVFVLVHNQSPIENYPFSADMIEKGVKAIPSVLWKYGIDMYFEPKPIRNLEQYLFDLRVPRIAVMSSNKGIAYKGLYYLPQNDKGFFSRCRMQGRKRRKIEIRIDPRSVYDVWYLWDNRVIKATLNKNVNNTNGFDKMTWAEYDEYMKKLKDIKHEQKMEKESIDATAYAIYESTIEPAVKRKKASGVLKSDSKNMREQREIAKHDEQYKNRTSKILDDEKYAEQISINDEKKEKEIVSSDADGKIVETDDSFEAFFDGL